MFIVQGDYRCFGVCILPTIVFLLGQHAAAYSDLENFVRILGSLNPNTSTVNYLNGSVFWKQPGSNLKKIFNYEGYNINRKLHQPDGTFLSLSREFVVYRDPIASQILQVWMNPASGQANEVFSVANDPVNVDIDSPSPSFLIPTLKPVYKVYNSDIVLEYPNPLDPDKYPKYSAGPVYDSVELFGFFANYTELSNSTSDSLPMTGTWMRKSEFLPWMEMGKTPGSLYYTTLAWKCNDGLSCVAEDIMDIINKDDPKYKTAPTTDEQPNETSWTVFKKIIDQRRLAGLPDIIIPQVNASASPLEMVYDVDNRVANVLYTWPLYAGVNGTAWSEIPGKQPIALFSVRGHVGIDFDPLPEGNGYRLQLDGFLQHYNVTTRTPLTKFYNPFTGQVVNCSASSSVGVDLVFERNSLYSMDMPSSKAVGLIGGQSFDNTTARAEKDSSGVWAVNLFNLIFPYEELAKKPEIARFYGTYATFQSWPGWMEMEDLPGNLVTKLTVSNGMPF